MMPEKARMPPIDRSNMPLIISTIMPQARMPVCAVSRRTTAALAGRGKVSGSRIGHHGDQQRRSARSSSSGRSVAMRRADASAREPASRSPPIAGGRSLSGATVTAHAASALSRALGAASSRMAISVAVAASSSPATRPSDMTTMRCASASTSGRSEETTSSAMPLRGEVAQDAVDVGLGADVDAARRLVDDQDARLARQPLGEQHLLLVAARQVAHLAVDARRRDAQVVDVVLG